MLKQLGIGNMIPQNKGKDLHKIPASKLQDIEYYASIKYDGHYTQIIKNGKQVTMLTSGGKEFYIAGLADYIRITFPFDFHIECEYNYDCDGLLGDRGKSAILTTYRTKFAKGIPVEGDPTKDIFRVLDLLDHDGSFNYRLKTIRSIFAGREWFHLPSHISVSLAGAKVLAEKWKEMGYEGAMCKASTHKYQIKDKVSRHNDIIKIKPRLTADLLCVGTKEGTGKYIGMIGSLLLEDSEGRQVYAGSGLDDDQRLYGDYMNTVIEIEYERIDDTYIQPIIKNIRSDKKPEEID